jgi:hypothetical protein
LEKVRDAVVVAGDDATEVNWKDKVSIKWW